MGVGVAWYLITFYLPPHWPTFVHPHDLGTLAHGVACFSAAWQLHGRPIQPIDTIIGIVAAYLPWGGDPYTRQRRLQARQQGIVETWNRNFKHVEWFNICMDFWYHD